MKNKFKYLMSLLLCLSLTSCNSKSFVGISKVNIAPNTVMGVEITDEVYNLSDVSFDLYLGFSDVAFEYEAIYGLYVTNKLSYYSEDREWVTQGVDYLNIPGHQFITSFTTEEALTQYPFEVKNNKVVYEKTITVKPNTDHYQISGVGRINRGILSFKIITFTKSTDGNYKVVTDKKTNQAIEIYYYIDDNYRVLFKGYSDDRLVNSYF